MEEFDYRPLLTGNSESVVIEDPAAGEWFIMLNGFVTYSDLTLIARYTQSVPTLGITLQRGKVILSWPVTANGFTLWYATDIGPSAGWMPVPTVPAVQAGQNVVDEATSGSSRFYRLTTP